jgi:hypothetical protein
MGDIVRLLRIALLSAVIVAVLAVVIVQGQTTKSSSPGVESPYPFTVPALSPAVIESITTSSGTSTLNCNIANCGLATSGALSQPTLGKGTGTNPNPCQGPFTITAVAGNTASFASTCSASDGPYPNAIGQWAGPFEICNIVSDYNCTQFLSNYDGQFTILQYQYNPGGPLASELDLDSSTGQVALVSTLQRNGFQIDLNGNACIGGSIAQNCPANNPIAFNYKGVATKYAGVNLDSGTFGNGLSGAIAEYNSTEIIGNLEAQTIYTTLNNAGFGGQGWYELGVQVVAVAGAPAAIGRILLQWTEPHVGGVAQYYPSNTATMDMSASGDIYNWTIKFYATANTPIQLSVATANSPVYFVNVHLVAQ